MTKKLSQFGQKMSNSKKVFQPFQTNDQNVSAKKTRSKNVEDEH